MTDIFTLLHKFTERGSYRYFKRKLAFSLPVRKARANLNQRAPQSILKLQGWRIQGSLLPSSLSSGNSIASSSKTPSHCTSRQAFRQATSSTAAAELPQPTK